MSIKTKLLILAIGTQLVIALAIGLNFVINAPVARLQAENEYFQKAAQKGDQLLGAVNAMTTMSFEAQYQLYKKTLDEYRETIGSMGKLERLSSISPKMKDAVDAVARLRDSTDTLAAKISRDAEGLLGAREALGLSITNDPTFVAIYARASSSVVDERARNIAQFHISNLAVDIRKLNDNLSLSVALIKDKDAAARAEVAKIKSRSGLASSLLVLLAFVASGILALRSASGIAKDIASIEAAAERMSAGDFTVRVGIERKDEIGELGRRLDSLLESLGGSLGRIQTVASQNREMGERLLEIATESTSSAVEIDANAESIRGRLDRIDGMVSDNVEAVSGISESVSSFDLRIGDQGTRISDSVAAVTQMIASIGNIDRVASKDRDAASELVRESEKGKEVFSQAFERIADIADSVNTIQEMAEVIARVASQTNVLAMNAAIEAAHAGEFGRGFAVVADEIAKLASASAQSSQEIGRTIADIVSKIGEADSTRQATVDAFNGISERIRQVSDSIGEIYQNVSEMQAGSEQVLGAMESLKETSSEIVEESTRIGQTTKSVGGSMRDLGMVSHEAAASIGEIAIGVREISSALQGVTAQSERLENLGQELDEAVAAFKTAADGSVEAPGSGEGGAA
jgi:methyl-accepting chemotaxis protein